MHCTSVPGASGGDRSAETSRGSGGRAFRRTAALHSALRPADSSNRRGAPDRLIGHCEGDEGFGPNCFDDIKEE
eukprot:scaffold34278_cov129-Isochrysis_galbana.AAC.2